MKKPLLLALSLLLAIQTSFADVESDYNRKRLVIQYYSGISGSWTDEGGNVSSYSAWRFHKGFTRITEAEFLEIAGYSKESIHAAKHRQTNTILTVSYLGLLSVGLLTMLVGIDSEAALIPGAVIMTSAVIPITIRRLRSTHWMSLDQAYAIQEDYNRKLLASLKAEN